MRGRGLTYLINKSITNLRLCDERKIKNKFKKGRTDRNDIGNIVGMAGHWPRLDQTLKGQQSSNSVEQLSTR